MANGIALAGLFARAKNAASATEVAAHASVDDKSMNNSITISRDSGYADRVRAYLVMVDGKELGRLKNGETKTFPLEPGTHKIVMKIDWCGSNTITFSLADGESARFTCGSSLRGTQMFFSLYYIIFARDQYLWLKQSD